MMRFGICRVRVVLRVAEDEKREDDAHWGGRNLGDELRYCGNRRFDRKAITNADIRFTHSCAGRRWK